MKRGADGASDGAHAIISGHRSQPQGTQRHRYGRDVSVEGAAATLRGRDGHAQAGFRALITNVVGIMRARDTEYQRAGSTCASEARAISNGGSTTRSIARPAWTIRSMKLPSVQRW